jgi:hypothetical protein
MDTFRTKRVPGRREGEDVLRDIDILQKTVNDLRGCGLIPRGAVHRFRTHEEADEWMMRQIAANHARHGSKSARPTLPSSLLKGGPDNLEIEVKPDSHKGLDDLSCGWDQS